MAEVRGFEVLQKELERTREDLRGVDDNIKKLTGHDPDNRRPVGVQRRVSLTEDGRDRIFNTARGGLTGESPGRRMLGVRQPGRRVLVEEESPSPAKRRNIGGAFSRLGPRVGISNRLGRQNPGRRGPESGDEEEADEKPAIQSSVVVTSKDNKTREEALEQQNKDVKGKARNRRMFGALLGTLQRFKVEETQHESQEKQRKEVERKLEVKARQEKEELRREKQTLFQERKQKQLQLKKLQQKIELVGIHEEWVAQTTTLMNFVRTKTKPYIFYLPKAHTERSKKKLTQSKQVLKDIITDRKKALEEEIRELAPMEDDDDQEEAMDESMDKEAEQEEGDGRVNQEAGEEQEDAARDSRRREKRERRRESRNTEDDTSVSPKKRKDSHSKEGKETSTTPKEQRKKRERRRESRGEAKKSTQNLEEKYQDEDGENWASGGEGQVKVTEEGMVVTSGDNAVDADQVEKVTRREEDGDKDEKMEEQQVEKPTEVEGDMEKEVDEKVEEEKTAATANGEDSEVKDSEAAGATDGRLRTPPPPPLPPNVPYEPPRAEVLMALGVPLPPEQPIVDNGKDNDADSEPTPMKPVETEEKPQEEPMQNVADIEVPPPPPPPPQPPTKSRPSKKRSPDKAKSKRDSSHGRSKNAKTRSKKDESSPKKKAKGKQVEKGKKYKKKVSRRRSDSESSSSSSGSSGSSGSSSSGSSGSSSSSSSSSSSGSSSSSSSSGSDSE